MEYFSEYKKQKDISKRTRAENWGIAIGLQQMDDLTPSEYLIDIARQNIEGEISIYDVEREVTRYYHKNVATSQEEQDKQQADKVAARIAMLLNEKTFSFNLAEYKSIHKVLFDGLLKRKVSGRIRGCDVTTEEEVLNGDIMTYEHANKVMERLDALFDAETRVAYMGLNKWQIVAHLTQLLADIWYIRPFNRGTGRVTAVFLIKYMDSLRLQPNKEVFENHAKYFKNALVRANYGNPDDGIVPTMEYLERFMGNLLLEEKNRLDNREMQIYPKVKKTAPVKD